MNKNPIIAPTTEILASILCPLIDKEEVADFSQNPKSYIAGKTGLSFEDAVSISVVQNSQDTQHLSLPYYSQIENLPNFLTDEMLDDVAGGEIFFIALPAAIGAAIGGGIAAVAFGGAGSSILFTAMAVGITVGGVAGGVAGAAATAGTIGGVYASEKAKKDGHK